MDLIAREVQAWLAEDVGDGDLTSLCVIDEEAIADALMLIKEPGIICGLTAAAAVFRVLEPLASATTAKLWSREHGSQSGEKPW